MSAFVISTSLGEITCNLTPDTAPVTAAHAAMVISTGVFNNTTFYRSDFVIQFGLYGSDHVNSIPNLSTNESRRNLPNGRSNTRGTLAVAHHDVPDNGNNEYFINLQDNTHLDEAYGGYAIFAVVADNDSASWRTINKIAASIKDGGGNVPITTVAII